MRETPKLTQICCDTSKNWRAATLHSLFCMITASSMSNSKWNHAICILSAQPHHSVVYPSQSSLKRRDPACMTGESVGNVFIRCSSSYLVLGPSIAHCITSDGS
ncbi:uncharacterized protein BO96DRAFT_21007 [Aspergillus niger CBS 101883]|uniref:uncharacterized protein n=1 Tax=Aspergillus lacticoffeatus (strain CBS 101883) TaxID=1450533 RepID=UPI000D7F2D00|nr:uncharacterized protein BO96DRAFT_21007 [Aspergillus niger CBS 101883]PYH62747.1 hypothetical protein BO96DRAFT_21007 [Aspergillus niger CBS 101883]